MPMTPTTASIEVAKAAAGRGFSLTSVRLSTPDGRSWSVEAQDGGGYRLFEISLVEGRLDQEHDAVEGNLWCASDLVVYLAAVGAATCPVCRGGHTLRCCPNRSFL